MIGDFAWTGWDYLGEAGVGRVQYVDDGGPPPVRGDVTGPFPWMTAGCGDIDITGHRRPQSYYREIVFGLRRAPFIAVHRPEHHGKAVAFSGPWSWTDSVSSWSWAGHEGHPVAVDVYSSAEEVELFVNGVSVGRQPSGAAHRFTATFETSYEPGEVVAVGYTAGVEVDRTSLSSAAGPVILDVALDRASIGDGDDDLAYVAITLVDETRCRRDRCQRLGHGRGHRIGNAPRTGQRRPTWRRRHVRSPRPDVRWPSDRRDPAHRAGDDRGRREFRRLPAVVSLIEVVGVDV